MYVVIGANGRVGGHTARALIDIGAKVRVLVRREEQAEQWRVRGAEAAVTTIEDHGGLVAALRGATGAFLLSPPPVSGDPYRRAEEIGSALAAAVQATAVPRVVALSSIGAQHGSGTGVIATLNTLERHLAGTAPSVTFLRPGYFVETWSEVAEAVVRDGVLPSFLHPSQKFPMVSAADVGRMAAGLLLEDVAGTRAVELRGPEDWSAADVADAFARVLSRPVQPVFVPAADRPAVLQASGVPTEVADALLGMYDGLGSGRVEREEGAEQRRGEVGLVDAIRMMMTVQAH